MPIKINNYIIFINNLCNQKCNFCSAKDKMKEKKEISLKDIFKNILNKGNYIQISGGEPLLNPEIFKIIYFIRKNKKNCFIELQTNGTLLLKNKNLDKLLKFYINLYNINYPSHIKKINDKIVGVDGTFNVREQAMKEIIKKGGKLRINIVLTKQNYRDLPKMISHIYKNFKGLEKIQFSFVKSIQKYEEKNKKSVFKKDIIPKYEEIKKYLIKALEKCEKYNIKVDVDHIPICFLGIYFKKHVDYHKIGLGEKGIFLKEKIYIKKCEKCDKKDICSGYRKDYLEIYGEKVGKI